ncbi:hypothetical protein AMECASPLE_020106 [Ameca splendens]|uniref:Uncharacterized protein n=1 Tax=Ameca splendens TaxID=208324 RepID=A0ABV1A029_9TELE
MTNMYGGEPMEIGKKFFVIVEGTKTGAQKSIVERVKGIGQTEVYSPEECDYFLVFCPIVSRVAADISGALNNIPGNKPMILVVMHHTRNRYKTLIQSSRQVHDPNVWLTVDFLFWEEELLNCTYNDQSWAQIQDLLRGSNQLTGFFRCMGWLKKPVTLAILAGVVVIVIVVVLIVVFTSKNHP